MEINPNHEVTKKAHDHWHKIVAIMLHKLGMEKFVITSADMETLPQDLAVGIHDGPSGLTVFLTDMATAEDLAKREGGLPV